MRNASFVVVRHGHDERLRPAFARRAPPEKAYADLTLEGLIVLVLVEQRAERFDHTDGWAAKLCFLHLPLVGQDLLVRGPRVRRRRHLSNASRGDCGGLGDTLLAGADRENNVAKSFSAIGRHSPASPRAPPPPCSLSATLPGRGRASTPRASGDGRRWSPSQTNSERYDVIVPSDRSPTVRRRVASQCGDWSEAPCHRARHCENARRRYGTRTRTATTATRDQRGRQRGADKHEEKQQQEKDEKNEENEEKKQRRDEHTGRGRVGSRLEQDTG